MYYNLTGKPFKLSGKLINCKNIRLKFVIERQ